MDSTATLLKQQELLDLSCSHLLTGASYKKLSPEDLMEKRGKKN